MAKFVQDPLVNKRKATEAHLEVDKKARVVEATSIEDQVALMHAPYANETYDGKIERKQSLMNKALVLLTAKIRMAHARANEETRDESEPFAYIKHHEGLNAGKICPLDDVIPLPVGDKYRNMCDFIIGKVNVNNFMLLTPSC